MNDLDTVAEEIAKSIFDAWSMSRLAILQNSLIKKQAEMDKRISEHFNGC